MTELVPDIIPLPYYTEGPATDTDGTIYCTTLTGGAILKFGNDNNWSTWAEAICPNGQYILPNNEHLVCDSRQATVSRYDSEGRFLRYEIEGKCSNAEVYVPNDLIVDKWGGIYFTDSVRQNGKVCFIAPDGVQHIVASGLDYPNGLALSADYKKLYVAESYKNRILILSLQSPGVAEGRFEVLAALPYHPSLAPEMNLPDGIALDNKGCLWVAHYGMGAVQVLDEYGKQIRSVKTPFPLVSNVFIIKGSPDMLIVTGGYAEPGPGALLRYTI